MQKTPTVAQARKRLAEIKELSARGEYSWDFNEYVRLSQIVPEEKQAVGDALTSARKKRKY